MSVVDPSYPRSAFLAQSVMFTQAFQNAFHASHKVDARRDSDNSVSSMASDSNAHADTPARSSSSALAFLTRGSSRSKAVEEAKELACDVAIRPSFCWNSHQEAWQSGVYSQFESGLKSCQDDAYACINFMGRSDAAFAGVFDGHGFNGRSAATYASRHITRWLGVDPNAASKDPKRRLKALESVCAQIDRGLARPELCGFDASCSGLATCCILLQGNRLCIATIGECKAVVGALDSNSASRLQAVDLSWPGSASRAPSETSLRRLSPSMMFAKTSMPVGGASSSRDPAALGHAFLGRGQSGQPSTAQPVMTLHQLGSQDQFVVLATSGVWEVMTPQEVVDFVHQSRQCRPAGLSCSAALSIEAQVRWKLKFAKVIAEDVAAVVVHYGTQPQPAQPVKQLPAFPQAATSNHGANDDNLLHETREFWARLQPESLVPHLQTETSKGKAPMPSLFFPTRTSPSAAIPIRRSPSSQHIAQRASSTTPFQGFAAPLPHPSSSQEGSQHSTEGSQHSTEGSHRSTDVSYHSAEGLQHSKDSQQSSRGRRASMSSRDSSKRTSHSGRSVRFDLPSSPDQSHHSVGAVEEEELGKTGDLGAVHGQIFRSKASVAFRPETPEMSGDIAGHLSASSSHSSIDMLSTGSPSPSNPPTPKASSPPSAQETVHKRTSSKPESHVGSISNLPKAMQQQSAQAALPTPFAAAAIDMHKSSSDLDLAPDDSAASTSQPESHSGLKSPKSTRTHVQQPLDEAEVQWEVANAAAPINAKVRLSMDRAHSAGGWTHPRRSFRTIPEDQPMGSSPPKEDAEAVGRPIRKIYPHGSGDLDMLLEPMSSHPPLASSPFAQATSAPQHLDLASIHAMPSFTQPTLNENTPRRLVTHLSMPAGQRSGDSTETEGRVRGGFFKVSSHPDLAAIAETAVQVTPFAGFEANFPNSQEAQDSPLALGYSSGSLDPWATPEQGSLLGSQRRSTRASLLGSVHGSRSRNSSAALEELLKLKFSNEEMFQPMASTSM